MIRKTLYLLLFVFCILGKDIAGTGLNIWYWTNKAEITQKYCENKSQPMLHCDGKCYLAKKLQKIAFDEYQRENQQNKPATPAKILLFSETIDFYAQLISFNEETNKMSFKEIHYPVASYSSEIFHPPTA